jgi:putative sigma-54 modulation protein
MDIIISAKDFKLTPSLKTYVEQKVGKLAHYWSKIIRARVELKIDHKQKSGDIFHIEVCLEVPGPDIAMNTKASEMHSAIDIVVPKLERQIVKIKGKFEARNRKVRQAKLKSFT